MVEQWTLLVLAYIFFYAWFFLCARFIICFFYTHYYYCYYVVSTRLDILIICFSFFFPMHFRCAQQHHVFILETHMLNDYCTKLSVASWTQSHANNTLKNVSAQVWYLRRWLALVVHWYPSWCAHPYQSYPRWWACFAWRYSWMSRSLPAHHSLQSFMGTTIFSHIQQPCHHNTYTHTH